MENLEKVFAAVAFAESGEFGTAMEFVGVRSKQTATTQLKPIKRTDRRLRPRPRQ